LEHLESLRAAIKRGEYLPPISIVKAENDKPGQFYLVDGFHRWWAHRDCNQETIEATILEGQGFIDALVASGGVNLKHGLRLEEDQKIENAWRCLNLPETDHYRRMNREEAAAALGVSVETIKRMRQKIKQWAVARGAMDPALRGNAANEALLAYWNENPAVETWRMARRDGSVERKDPKWQERKTARAIAQVLTDFEAIFGPRVVKSALSSVGYHFHNVKAEQAMTNVRHSFSVTAKPIQEDDEVSLLAVDMDEFLEWQKQQDHFHEAPIATPYNDIGHTVERDF
jgi:ParB-like chromosome segregation protein Spo0J